MPIKVRIPTPLQKLTHDKEEIELQASSTSSVRKLVDSLEKNYPGFKERICDPSGNLRRFVNIFVNDEDIRFLNKEETSLKEGDVVSIIPAIAGG